MLRMFHLNDNRLKDMSEKSPITGAAYEHSLFGDLTFVGATDDPGNPGLCQFRDVYGQTVSLKMTDPRLQLVSEATTASQANREL